MSISRLVVVSQEFPPDMSGLASRMRDMTTNLDDKGWEVDVVTPPPSFPHGEFDRCWHRYDRTTVDGVTAHQLWAWQPAKADPGMLSRLAFYVTFILHATLWLLVYGRRYDVVLTTTPPISTGLAGFVPTFGDTRWVVDVRDLWIDASVSLGFIEPGGFIERVSRRFQRRVLTTADSIAVTTETLGETLCEQFGSDLSEKVTVVPNGVDMSRFGTAEPESISSGVATDDSPVVVYVGNIGHAQALDVCVQAMDRMSEDAVFRLIGGGDAVPRLKRLTETVGVADRVSFVDPVPREEIPDILRDADVGVAPIVDSEELAYAIPTKVYEYLGCGLPVVVTGSGEVRRFVESSGGGLYADADPDAVAAALDALLADVDYRSEIARTGYEHVRTAYDRETIATRFDDHLRELLDQNTSSEVRTEIPLGARGE